MWQVQQLGCAGIRLPAEGTQSREMRHAGKTRVPKHQQSQSLFSECRAFSCQAGMCLTFAVYLQL